MGKQSSEREERYNNRVKSDSDCFEIISCDDGAGVLNEVVMESVKEKVSVDCGSDEIDENEQCAQPYNVILINKPSLLLINYKIILKW